MNARAPAARHSRTAQAAPPGVSASELAHGKYPAGHGTPYPQTWPGEFETLISNLPDVVFRLDKGLGKTAREVGMAPDACDVFEVAAQRALRDGEPQVIQFTDRGRTFRTRLATACREIPTPFWCEAPRGA